MKKILTRHDRSFILGWNLGRQPGFDLSWLYRPHEKLGLLSPRDYSDGEGDFELVEKAFCEDFKTTLENPEFST